MIFRDFWRPPCTPSLKGDSSKNDGFFSISLECLLGCTSGPSGSLPDPFLDGLGPLLGAPGASWAASWPPRAVQDAAKNRKKTKKNAQTTHFCLSWCFWGSLGLVLAPLGLILDAPGTVFSPPGRLPEVFYRPSDRLLGYSRDLPEICLKWATILWAPIAWNPLRVRRSPRSVLQ